MADNQETEVKQKPKSNATPRDKAIKTLNRVLMGLLILSLGLVILQVVQFFGVYGKKQEEMAGQGRIMEINAKTNAVKLQDMTEEALDKLGKAASEQAATVGPEPDKTDVAKEAKPLDYNNANLAIIITEIGMKQSELDSTRDLPKEVTFAFSPYADDLQKKIDAASKDGRQVMLNLPMQPASFPIKDNGPYSIQINYDDATNMSRMANVGALAQNYTGLLATSDEVVTAKTDKITPVLQEIAKQNTFIGYFKNNNNVTLENQAKPLTADIFGVDYMVDETPGDEEVNRVLAQVKEDLVVRNKKIIIAIHPYPTSIAALKKWLAANLGPNVQIAPISYFITNN